jgi:ABC-2 type transport system permease protein
MPAWLRGFAEHQPFTPATEALRAFLLGDNAGWYGWTALAWCLGLGLAGWVGAAVVFSRRLR